MDGVVRGVRSLVAFVRSIRLILNCVYASFVVFFLEQSANFSDQFMSFFGSCSTAACAQSSLQR